MRGVVMLLIMTTVKKESTEEISKKIVEERLAACSLTVNLESSKFLWKGKLDEYKEDLIIFKTVEKNSDKVFERIKELHPYEVPFICQLNADKVSEKYGKWLNEVTE